MAGVASERVSNALFDTTLSSVRTKKVTVKARQGSYRGTQELKPYPVSKGTPRAIRARLARAPGKKPLQAAEVPSPASPNSPVALNVATGRVALGPWLGPFGADPAVNMIDGNAIIFMDRSGSVHFELNDSLVKPADHAHSVSSGTLVAASVGRRAHSKEMTAVFKHSTRARQDVNTNVRKMRHLNQPRRN